MSCFLIFFVCGGGHYSTQYKQQGIIINSGRNLLKLQAQLEFWQSCSVKTALKELSGTANHYGANWFHRHGFMLVKWNSKYLWAQLILTPPSPY